MHQREATAAENRYGFNSLQTGKHICTYVHWRTREVGWIVSIPFKRESIYAHDVEHRVCDWVPSFNSLQTGKHICTSQPLQNLPMGVKFQFPSNGKAYMHTTKNATYRAPVVPEFQFPSNGKAYMHLPYFRPPPRLTPEPLIQTRTARGFFLLKNWSENRLNPYEYSSKRDFCQKTRQNVGTV